MEVDSSTILYSDSAIVRIRIAAPKQFEFDNGNKEFPNKIFIEFFEPTGELSSTLEANTAYYIKETNLYHAVGDVEVIGYLEPQKLNTEELFWDPEDEEIYTEKFVKIETDDQISTGNGLRARQDFSSYRILNPEGTIYLEDSELNGREDSVSRKPVVKSVKKPDFAKKMHSSEPKKLERLEK